MTDVSSIVKLLKKDGKYAVNILSGDGSPCIVSDYLSTSCLALDRILGGGLPVGRVTQIWGSSSAGKSLIAEQVVAWTQQLGYPAMYLDTESAVSIDMMRAVGVDVDNLIYSIPENLESLFQLMEDTIKIVSEKMPDKKLLIVWDSVAASPTKREAEGDYGKSSMGNQAFVISQGMKKIAGLIAKTQTCCLFLNQVRQNVGVMFGDADTSPGGNALEFYSSVIIKLQRRSKIKNAKGRPIGVETLATCTKNKLSAPFRSCTLPIYFGTGIDDTSASFRYLKDNGLIVAAGSYYSIPEAIALSLKNAGLRVPEKFQQKNWEQVYVDYFDTIAELVFYDDTTVD